MYGHRMLEPTEFYDLEVQRFASAATLYLPPSNCNEMKETQGTNLLVHMAVYLAPIGHEKIKSVSTTFFGRTCTVPKSS
jgi:hypothetical protein